MYTLLIFPDLVGYLLEYSLNLQTAPFTRDKNNKNMTKPQIDVCFLLKGKVFKQPESINPSCPTIYC